MEQGKIMKAEVPTVRVRATPTGLTAPPLPQPPKIHSTTYTKLNSVLLLNHDTHDMP